MVRKKSVKTKGKLQFSKYFQKFEKGDRVAVIRELAVQPRFPSKLQGRSGMVDGKRGQSYIVKIKDLKKEKTYIIHPVHLKKLITIQQK